MEEPEGYEKQAELFQALSHPVRLRILDLLARREACVCHLTAVLRRPQPYVSQQLSMLRDANLVADRREGTLIFYRLRDERLAELIAMGRELVGDTATSGVPEVPVPGCPCPRCRPAEATA